MANLSASPTRGQANKAGLRLGEGMLGAVGLLQAFSPLQRGWPAASLLHLAYLVNPSPGEHGGSEGKKGSSLQQHGAHTGLVAGNQDLGIC